MAKFEGAVLIGSEDCEYPRIDVVHPEFIVGRARSSSFVIRNLSVSKLHCIFKRTDGIWTVIDKSSYGTYINCKRLEKDKPSRIREGDKVSFGISSSFKYVFCTEDISKNPAKRMRLNEYINSEEQKLQNKREVVELKGRKHTADIDKRHVQEERRQLQDRLQSCQMEQQHENLELGHQQAKEGTQSQEKLLEEKRLLEEKLKEMKHLLEEKEKGQSLLKKQLHQKEEQRLQDLKRLQKRKCAQSKVMLEKFRKEIEEKDRLVKIQLIRDIQTLHKEKLKIENDIQGELSKKVQLKEELEKVKTDLSNAQGRKQCLQEELEEVTKAKEDAESRLKAKQDVLANIGELVEAELQCSICSELFVTATTLNCTHTFCRSCIVEWQEKENTCPICRTRITSQNRSLVFDTFINQMVENLSVEMKNRRQEVIEVRLVQELLGPKSECEPTHQPQRRHSRRNSPSAESSSSSDELSEDNNSDINFSSPSSSDIESDSDNTSDESSVEGDPGAYYGGYGCCFHCGRKGHWATGCPFH